MTLVWPYSPHLWTNALSTHSSPKCSPNCVPTSSRIYSHPASWPVRSRSCNPTPSSYWRLPLRWCHSRVAGTRLRIRWSIFSEIKTKEINLKHYHRTTTGRNFASVSSDAGDELGLTALIAAELERLVHPGFAWNDSQAKVDERNRFGRKMGLNHIHMCGIKLGRWQTFEQLPYPASCHWYNQPVCPGSPSARPGRYRSWRTRSRTAPRKPVRRSRAPPSDLSAWDRRSRQFSRSRSTQSCIWFWTRFGKSVRGHLINWRAIHNIVPMIRRPCRSFPGRCRPRSTKRVRQVCRTS